MANRNNVGGHTAETNLRSVLTNGRVLRHESTGEFVVLDVLGDELCRGRTLNATIEAYCAVLARRIAPRRGR